MKQQGFTLLEIILVVGIFAILLVVSMAAFGGFRDDSQLQSATNDIQAILRLAQNKTVASEGAGQYGVYFNLSSSPHEYVLFQGASYASGTVDQIYQLSNLVEFSSASTTFSGLSGQEVVFDRIQGRTGNEGEVVLQSTIDTGNVRTISVSSGGGVDVNAGIAPTDADRIKDTRHVHITYAGRAIDTVGAGDEKILLDFEANGTVDETIIVTDNLSGGQIVWEGTVDVGGEDQKIKVHTHTLNDVGNTTVFSIHRDRRFNTKSLLAKLEDDDDGTGSPAGKLIEYDASGQLLIDGFESTYVTNIQEQ